MKRIIVCSLLGLLAVIAVYAQTQNATQQEVLNAYRALDQTQVTKDRATMERLMADDYLYTHSNGTVANKAQDIAETISPDSKWTAVKSDDLKVRVYGDVAVITGLGTLTGSAKGYQPGPRRFTDLWVRRNGRWQSIGGQSTLVPAK